MAIVPLFLHPARDASLCSNAIHPTHLSASLRDACYHSSTFCQNRKNIQKSHLDCFFFEIINNLSYISMIYVIELVYRLLLPNSYSPSVFALSRAFNPLILWFSSSAVNCALAARFNSTIRSSWGIPLPMYNALMFSRLASTSSCSIVA